MDRFAAMIILLGVLVTAVLLVLALFAVAPITTSCVTSLLYSLYLFIAYEESGVHHAQEHENRFWTVFAVLLSTALFFAVDSPLAFGLWSPSLGFLGVLVSGYAMHLWDRHLHRLAISRQTSLRRTSTANSSLVRLRDLGIPVEEHLQRINECLKDIDQLLIPSTINNFINQRFMMQKEREIITIFEECDARALNHLIGHVQLALLFYKIKDHRNFNGKHRTELINLLAVERLSILTVISRVIVLHSLQLLKLRANPRAEYWVRNILLKTHQDDLSDLKTMTDAKGDYFSMNKLIYDDIRSESVRQDILNHLRREAAVQQTHLQMGSRRLIRQRTTIQWRKVLSDVDDTLYCSGGMYPAGIDKNYPKKAVYPGVLAFYRELDLGTQGPEEWQEDRVGNLVFLSARPHVYKDISEKANFAKFIKLRSVGQDGRKGLHTMPSLLAGDLASGGQYVFSNDFEPLARKKFDNFRRYVSIYPEYKHVFVCDNGQGDVRAGEMMFDSFPYEFEALYVHVVQDIPRTYGYAPIRWQEKEFRPVFFRTYVEAAMHAANQNPPLIRISGLRRICIDSAKDFAHIKPWPSEAMKALRRQQINQAIWNANSLLLLRGEPPVELILAERRFEDGDKVRTPYGIGKVRGFEPSFDLYDIEIDWRPLDVQLAEHLEEAKKAAIRPKPAPNATKPLPPLETVVETEEAEEDAVTPRKDEAKEESDHNRRSSSQEVGESSAEQPERTPPQRIQYLPDRISTNDMTVKAAATEQQLEAQWTPKKSTTTERQTRVFASIAGRSVSKLTPPVLPKPASKQRGSLFTFLQTAPTAETPKQVQFKEGDQVTTPYGPARVAEHRQKNRIVVVDMIGWHARGYLNDSVVKVASKGLFGSFMRQLSSSDKDRSLEFPHLEGTIILTPFGRGKVTRPLPVIRPGMPRTTSARAPTTIGISLQAWTLANGKHPMLYCTVETARKWKDRKEDGSSIFSALGTLMVSSRTLLEPFLLKKQAIQEPPKLFTRYYEDAAAVTTSFGPGVVVGFRPIDGFYEIALSQWTLANGSHPKAYLRKEDISHRVAKGCLEGYPVLTNLGLTGTLASVVPTTGVHIVTVPSAGMVCYLQPECVIRALKAAVGEDVWTAYGDGRVERYDLKRDMYTIKFKGWNGRLYAKGEGFDRVGDGIQDRDGVFGVKWLLRFLFLDRQPSQRSRSNSVVSGTQSTRSQSSRSIS